MGHISRSLWKIASILAVGIIVTSLIIPGTRRLYYDPGVSADDPGGSFNSTADLGWELLDNGSVFHMWNGLDSYYFNRSNGIQFSNHYNEYWTKNVLMIGYYTGGNWNLLYRVDELSGFNEDLEAVTGDYINVTLSKNLTYGSYSFRLGIRYHLSVNDSNLTVLPFVRNLGPSIPFDVGFGWEMKDINIAGTTEDNWVRHDSNASQSTYFDLSQNHDRSWTNLTYKYTDDNQSWTWRPETRFYLEHRDENNETDKFLYLDWNPDLDYKLTLKSRPNQENTPVTLFINAGSLAAGAQKGTRLYWYDADCLWGTPKNLYGNYADGRFRVIEIADGQLLHMAESGLRVGVINYTGTALTYTSGSNINTNTTTRNNDDTDLVSSGDGKAVSLFCNNGGLTLAHYTLTADKSEVTVDTNYNCGVGDVKGLGLCSLEEDKGIIVYVNATAPYPLKGRVWSYNNATDTFSLGTEITINASSNGITGCSFIDVDDIDADEAVTAWINGTSAVVTYLTVSGTTLSAGTTTAASAGCMSPLGADIHYNGGTGKNITVHIIGDGHYNGINYWTLEGTTPTQQDTENEVLYYRGAGATALSENKSLWVYPDGNNYAWNRVITFTGGDTISLGSEEKVVNYDVAHSSYVRNSLTSISNGELAAFIHMKDDDLDQPYLILGITPLGDQPPTISNPGPSDGAFNVSLTTDYNVTLEDDSASVTVDFYLSTDNSTWSHVGHNASAQNGNIQTSLSGDLSSYQTTYYVKTTVNDTARNLSFYSSFETTPYRSGFFNDSFPNQNFINTITNGAHQPGYINATELGSASIEFFDQFSGTDSANFDSQGNWSDGGGDYKWEYESDGTPSSSTGANCLPTPQSTGSYLFTESSSRNGKDYYIESSTFTGSNNVTIDFYYHMYGSSMGTLKVQIWDGTAWDDLWTKTGQQSTSYADWKHGYAYSENGDSHPYTGTTKIRIYGLTGSSYRSDMCIGWIYVNKTGGGAGFNTSVLSENISRLASSWDKFYSDVNNTANSTFSIVDPLTDYEILSNLNGDGDDISSVTNQTIRVKATIDGAVSIHSWNLTYGEGSGKSWTDGDAWNTTLEASSSWNNGDAWNTTLAAPASSWNDGDSWNTTIDAGASWTNGDAWNTTLETSSSWNIGDSWNTTLAAPASSWNDGDSWNTTLDTTAGWTDGDAWNITLEALGGRSWTDGDAWNTTLDTSAGWTNGDAWNTTLAISTAWNDGDSWNTTIDAGSHWTNADSWNLTLQNISSWTDGDSWNTTLAAPASSWNNGDSWNLTIDTGSTWTNGDSWNLTLEASTTWNDGDSWNTTLETSSSWNDGDAWNITLQNISSWRDCTGSTTETYEHYLFSTTTADSWDYYHDGITHALGVETYPSDGTKSIVFYRSGGMGGGNASMTYNGSKDPSTIIHVNFSILGDSDNDVDDKIYLQYWSGNAWATIDVWCIQSATWNHYSRDVPNGRIRFNAVIDSSGEYYNVDNVNITFNQTIGGPWSTTLETSSSWNDGDAWNTTLSTPASWITGSSWNIILQNISTWHDGDDWNTTLQNISSWHDGDDWNTTLAATEQGPNVTSISTSYSIGLDCLNYDIEITIEDPNGDAFTYTVNTTHNQNASGSGTGSKTFTHSLTGVNFTEEITLWINSTDTHLNGNYTYTFTAAEASLNSSFTYHIEGQTVILSPSLGAGVDAYRWIVENRNLGTSSNSEWIDRNYTDPYQYVLDWNTSYFLQLQVRNETDTREITKTAGLGTAVNNTPISLKPDDDDDNQTSGIPILNREQREFKNFFKTLPQPVQDFLNVWGSWILLVLVISGLTILLLSTQKKKNKKELYHIDRNQRKK